jgi:mRNA deadenylase 3'-5' endonuclease subunit Ccr4
VIGQRQPQFTGSTHVPVAKIQQRQSLFTGSTHVPFAKMQHVQLTTCSPIFTFFRKMSTEASANHNENCDDSMYL